LKIIAALEEPAAIVRILTHLDLPARARRRGRLPRSLGRSKCVDISWPGPMQGTKNPRQRAKFSPNTAPLTLCWAVDIVTDGEKIV